jgi:hypothetical protein
MGIQRKKKKIFPLISFKQRFMPGYSDRVRNLKGRIGLNNCFIVDGVGKGGGLALFWCDEIKIQVLSYGLHHIDTLIWDGVHHAAWRGTFIYGEPRTQDKMKMWELLR